MSNALENDLPKKEEKKVKMKKWPDDPSVPIHYYKLMSPLFDIINKGYSLVRKNINSFEYDGYNIGKNELELFPSPKQMFSEKFLEKENKRNIKLINIVLNVAFLLGVEQGRRSEHIEQKSTDLLIATLQKYRETNKDLRRKVDELAAALKAKEEHPNLSSEETSLFIKNELEKKRNSRIEEAKKELAEDKTKSLFSIKTQEKVSFSDLIVLYRSLSKENKTKHWEEILSNYGWTKEAWDERCSKKVNTITI